MKDEEIRQRTYIHDPRTGTKVWGLTIEMGGKVGRRGKNWDNCNSTNDKKGLTFQKS